MVEILRRGSTREYMIIEHHNCGSQLKVFKTDVDYTPDSRDGNYWVGTCPVCHMKYTIDFTLKWTKE